ncbi:DNA polymerase I [Arthrobacter phage Oxynfrius]|uniref:DNA polymerase I n=1 Tax=Arthrobacter phage Oxynfrius TaxID=1897429 RepID=A0A1I9SE07_9CAUD|nr:DNA polymerase I [Arthrobacter phage Oxynfrius]AOZ65084.1 DNA polymerase I [Arthrobacter phage Oxynfrius]
MVVMPERVLPSDLLHLMNKHEIFPTSIVAVDTETSGLRTDEGARISTVSVAWADPSGEWDFVQTEQWPSGISTYREEPIYEGWPDCPVVSFAWPFDQGVSGTGKPEDSGQETLWPDAENLPLAEYMALLEFIMIAGEDHGLTMQNMKFDLHQFRAGVRRWPGIGDDFVDLVKWDTQNGNDLIYGYLPSTSLKGPGTATEHLWGAAESDEKHVISAYLTKKKLPKGRWDLMPWDVIAKYADQDARLTVRLALRQEDDIKNGKVSWMDGKQGRMTAQQAMDRRMNMTRLLYAMEKRGLPFDIEEAQIASAELKFRAKQFAKDLPFKPATLDMAKHYWFGTGLKQGVVGLEQPPVATTAGGAPSLTAHDLGKLILQDLPGASVWRNFAKCTDADSRWYEGWVTKAGADGRLRTSVRQNGTRSGRFSVEGIQLQAIPQNYKLSGYEGMDDIPSPRALIGSAVAKMPDWEMWELDLANAELRVAALFAGCQRMLDMIDKGMDLHGETAKELFDASEDDENWDQRRSIAKRANFSLIFGVGWATLQQNIEVNTGIVLSDREAQVLVKDWNGLYPEYKRAINVHMDRIATRQKSKKELGGYLQMSNGERRWFASHEDTHKGFNQRVQPSLAQFGIDWWTLADAYISSQLTPEELEHGGTVLLVHDSMVLLLPKDLAEKIIEEVIRIGVELWSRTFVGVPGGVDAKPWNK